MRNFAHASPNVYRGMLNGVFRGELERRQRRGASGAPVVEKRTERGQGALLGPVGLFSEPLNRHVSVPSGSGHHRSLPSMIDQFSAISIIEPLRTRLKIVLMSQKTAEQEATRLITLPATGLWSKP